MAINLVRQERNCISLSKSQSHFPPTPGTIRDATVELEYSSFRASPDMWTREEVRYWLEGCVNEYGLNLDLPDRFPMNGRGLCMLRKEDFRERAPDAGDVLYNSFHAFYDEPSTLHCGRRIPDTSTLKRKAMNLEVEDHWFDPSFHRSEHQQDVEYKHVVDSSSEPLNLKITRSRHTSPQSPSPQPPLFTGTPTFHLYTSQPFPLFRSPTLDPALNRTLPLNQGPSTFDSALNRPLISPGSATFDSMRSHDRVDVPFPAEDNGQSHLHTSSLHSTYLPLLIPLPYDLKRSIPTPSASPPSSLLSSSSSSSSSLLSPRLSSSLFPSTLSTMTPSSSPKTSPQHTTELPSYHSSLSSSTSYLLSPTTSPAPPTTVPSSMYGCCTPSPSSVPASSISLASSSATIYCDSPTSVTTIGNEETGRDQRLTPNLVSTSNEATTNWSPLMSQVSTTSPTPEGNPKIHLNLSTSDRLLWKFLAELLNCKTAKCVSWEDRERLTFQIVDPDELAELWGIEKCKPGMTYEKLSRALRYYYKMNIIAKVPGKRLTYRFITSPQFIKKGKRGAKPGIPHKRRTGAPLSKTVINQNQTKLHQQQKQQQLQDGRNRL